MTEANDKRGPNRDRRFVVGVWLLLGTLTGIYLFCHFCCPPAKAPELATLAGMSSDAELEIRDRSQLNWYLGPARVEAAEAEAAKRSEQMRRLREAIETGFGEIRRRTFESNPRERDRLLAALNNGHYAEAYRSFERFLVSLSRETRSQVLGPGLVFDMRENLRQITEHAKQQDSLLRALQPVVTSSFVWGDPDLLLLDVFFWALFGVLIHLLWSSSEAFGKPRAMPERIISLAKLLYGPVLAVGILHALSAIFSPVLGFGLRVWLYPAIGLLVGLMSRSIVSYFDRLATRLRAEPLTRKDRDHVVATAVAAAAAATSRARVAADLEAPLAPPVEGRQDEREVLPEIRDEDFDSEPVPEPPVHARQVRFGEREPEYDEYEYEYDDEDDDDEDLAFIEEIEDDQEHWRSADEEFDRAVVVTDLEEVELEDPGEPIEGDFGYEDDEEEPLEEPALRPAASGSSARDLAALREAMRPRDFDDLRRLAKELAELTLRARIEEGEAKV